MDTVLFPTLEEALYIHSQLIERFGGTEGVRDPGLLESALSRPRSGYYKSLSEQAAALMHSLIGNHCFVDGNKRMGLTLALTFLRMNGVKVSVSAKEGERFIIKEIIEKKADVVPIATWLEKHSTPL
jgi:death-on-curing protein